MNVNFSKKTISKPNGKRTPSATITFRQLCEYIHVWSKEVRPMLTRARSEINVWRNAGRPVSQIHNVLHGIIVTFGEGNRRPWPCVQKFLAGGLRGSNTVTANNAITTVDKNISTITAVNILGLFGQLALIKGLGSKSYSSKVLRCLCDDHVVLDSLINEELAERIYITFRKKCEDIAKAMYPPCSPADVEGGLFAWLQILNPNQTQPRWKRWQIPGSINCNVQIEHIEPYKPNKSAHADRHCIWLEEGPKSYLKIVDDCGGGNIGMICLNHKNPHIWLKNDGANPRYLIGDIHDRGGDFTAEPNYIPAPHGVPNCSVGGSNYQGGVRFGSIEAVVKYLKKYFTVRACAGNTKYDQPWIDKL